MTTTDVLEAVRRLFEESRFQDVHFRCLDGRVVSSNRAFLAARCDYFDRLLFGDLMEASCTEIRLQASSEAVRHVLMHLHTGGFGSIEQEACWITLMEASSLAQQYMLPGMVQHVADRLSADLRPENLGLALSYALKADLQAVIQSIWVALPRLLQRPFAVDSSFSADAICFCLRHTAWMAPLAASGTSTTGAIASTSAGASNAIPAPAAAVAAAAAAAAGAAGGAGGNAAPLAVVNDGMAMRRASSMNGASTGGSSAPQHAEGAVVSSRCAAGCKADSSMAQEVQAFNAVIGWMLHEVAGCADCQCSRHAVRSGCPSALASPRHGLSLTPRTAALGTALTGSSPRTAAATALDLDRGSTAAGTSSHNAVSPQQPEVLPAAGCSGGSTATATAAGMGRASSGIGPLLLEPSSVQAQHPAMLPSSRPSSRQAQLSEAAGPSRAAGTSGVARRLSSRNSQLSSSIDSDASGEAMQYDGGAEAAAAAGLPLPLDATGVFAVLTVTPRASSLAAVAAAAATAGMSRSSSSRLVSPATEVSPAAVMFAADGASTSTSAAAAAAATGAPGSDPPAAEASRSAVRTSATADSVGALIGQQQSGQAAADGGDEPGEHEGQYSGSCCTAHQAMLLQMLAHLNWHLLEPCVLERLDSLALLGPTALLELYRAHQRCTHMSLWGNFPSLSLGSERGLRCFNSGGEQVLECESVSHLTAAANLAFTSGKHCWQFVVSVPCDLVWLGLSDGNLQPDVWGGKQPGGWFYGSNDALCHNKQSDRHAYTKHCGNGKWGEGAVVDVCVDMDAREVWFGIDGAEPKLGFTGLPDRVYPAVSLRAPAQLVVRFRAASWMTAEWNRGGGGSSGSA